MTRKSDHKHGYVRIPITDGWYTHELRCAVCGHVTGRIRIENAGG